MNVERRHVVYVNSNSNCRTILHHYIGQKNAKFSLLCKNTRWADHEFDKLYGNTYVVVVYVVVYDAYIETTDQYAMWSLFHCFYQRILCFAAFFIKPPVNLSEVLYFTSVLLNITQASPSLQSGVPAKYMSP